MRQDVLSLKPPSEIIDEAARFFKKRRLKVIARSSNSLRFALSPAHEAEAGQVKAAHEAADWTRVSVDTGGLSVQHIAAWYIRDLRKQSRGGEQPWLRRHVAGSTQPMETTLGALGSVPGGEIIPDNSHQQAKTMLQELEGYYKENGILSTSFTCPYKNQCRGNCAEFTGPKSAFVSTGYERRYLPRLLFLSLDSGSGDKEDRNRLPMAVRRQEEIESNISTLHKGKHWYRTHELAWHIFRQFDPKIGIKDTRRYFAHANSAKCCMNKPQRGQADDILFKNCRKYLQGELAILCPDIIVTQGDWAKKAVGLFFGGTCESIGGDKYASRIEMNGRKVFWLHTYHPRYAKGFKEQKSLWDKYSRMIYEFIKAQTPRNG